MANEFKTWFEDLGSKTKGFPQISDLPEVDAPGDPLPSSLDNINELEDEELSYKYQIIAKWQAVAESHVGVYLAAESGFGEELAQIRRQVYMEMFGKTKPANKERGDIFVEQDERVRKASEKYQAIKQTRILFQARSKAFSQLAMTYGMERNNRLKRMGI